MYLEYNKTAENFKGDSDLVKGGWDQHYAIGKSLRTKLVDEKKLLSSDYVNTEVYVQSTNANRTHMSAIAHLSGLFPNNAPANPWLNAPVGATPRTFVINQVS